MAEGRRSKRNAQIRLKTILIFSVAIFGGFSRSENPSPFDPRPASDGRFIRGSRFGEIAARVVASGQIFWSSCGLLTRLAPTFTIFSTERETERVGTKGPSMFTTCVCASMSKGYSISCFSSVVQLRCLLALGRTGITPLSDLCSRLLTHVFARMLLVLKRLMRALIV